MNIKATSHTNTPRLGRLHDSHLTATTTLPDGWQVLISKARVVVDGQVTLQTSAMISFSTSTGAMLALRRVGISGSMAVPLEESATLVGRIRAINSYRLHLKQMVGRRRAIVLLSFKV